MGRKVNLEVSWHRGCGAAPLKCLELSLVFLSVRIQARCSLSLQVKAPTRQRRLGGSLVKDCKPDTSTVQSTAPGAIDRALDGPRMQTTRAQGAPRVQSTVQSTDPAGVRWCKHTIIFGVDAGIIHTGTIPNKTRHARNGRTKRTLNITEADAFM